MSDTYSQMTEAELKAALQSLQEELEDLEDDKMMVLGQQGQHISATSYAARFDKMIAELKEKIEQVGQLIAASRH